MLIDREQLWQIVTDRFDARMQVASERLQLRVVVGLEIARVEGLALDCGRDVTELPQIQIGLPAQRIVGLGRQKNQNAQQGNGQPGQQHIGGETYHASFLRNRPFRVPVHGVRGPYTHAQPVRVYVRYRDPSAYLPTTCR